MEDKALEEKSYHYGKYHTIVVDGKHLQEHRYIMEQYLGRKLTDNEVVHHINGIKNDNQIENLQVMTKKEHATFHRKNKNIGDSNYWHEFTITITEEQDEILEKIKKNCGTCKKDTVRFALAEYLKKHKYT